MSSEPHYPHSRNLRAGRVSEPFACYSITKNVAQRRRLPNSDLIARIVFGSWNHLRQKNDIKVLAFCLMPDHYHLLLCLLEQKTLPEVMSSINKFTAREINSVLGIRGRFWQEGFFDRRCWNDDETDELSIYVEHNPVRAGLVESADQWPYSSAHPQNDSILDRIWYAQTR